MSKPVNLYAYIIENEDVSRPYSDFAEKFHEKLGNSITIRQRYYEVNSETHEVDVLSQSARMDNNCVYGALMRVIPSKEMPGLPADYLDKQEISFSELEGAGVETGKMSCKDLYYFVLDNHHLVTTMPVSRISRFRAFVNFFLGTESTGKPYQFSVMIMQPENIQLQELRKIEFSGIKQQVIQDTPPESTGFQVFNMATEILKKLLGEEEIAPLLEKEILTANLVVKFNDKGKKKMNEDDVKRALSAVVSNLNDNPDVKFSTKDNRSIKAGETVLRRTVDIDTAENDLLNETDLRQQMLAFLHDIQEKTR